MTAIRTWLRLDLRRRWRSLAVLALLVALASGTVIASLAGARRGGSALDRLAAVSLPATVAALPNDPEFDWDPIRALPEVEAIARFPVSGFSVEGIPDSDNPGQFPVVDAAAPATIERGVYLQGRPADQSRVDEGVVTAAFLTAHHKKVGDTVVVRLAGPEQVDEGSFGTGGTGPRQPVRIVGVLRSPWYTDAPGSKGGLVCTAAFTAKYRTNLLGTQGRTAINALLRLRGGTADIPRFKADLARITGRTDIDVWDLDARMEGARGTMDFERSALLAFAIAVVGAAVFLIGQSVVRFAAGAVADLHVLQALGLTPRQAVAIGAAGTTVAGVAGGLLGLGAAVLASPIFPIGAGAFFEPHPGLDADWTVLLLCLLGTVLLLLVGSVGTAAAALAGQRSGAGARRSLVATTASRLGLPVPVIVGSRFALEPGRGRSAVPVRPALAGAVAGVLGVLAALTFQAGVADATDNPARFGQTFQIDAFTGFNGEGAPDDVLAGALRTVSADPDVTAGATTDVQVASIGVESVTVYSFRPVGPPLPTVAEIGRMPAAADEIALAPSTLRHLRRHVGDTVEVVGGTPANGAEHRATMHIVGSVYVPTGSHNEYDDGGWLTPAGYQALFAGVPYKFRQAYFAVRPGADTTAVVDRITKAVTGPDGEAVGSFEVTPPPLVIGQLRVARQLPLFLGGFLALLAVGAIGHALATAVRRRRHDVAVLRALGLTRRQARLIVVVQATLLAVVGLLFGVPLGLALGRTVWRVVADNTPAYYVAPLAVLAIALIAPAALLVVNLLAAWPGHRVARLRIGHVLRTE